MTSTVLLVVGFIVAIALLSSIPRVPGPMRVLAGIGAIVVLLVSFTLASVRFVGDDEVGVVIKNVGVASLPEGQIVATNGEKGPQASILAPGWHPWLWPVIYDVEIHKQIIINQGEVGLITTADGAPLPTGEVFAPEWSQSDFQQMLDAQYFLTSGAGVKGPQTSVLTPGRYRVNPKLYRIEKTPVTNIEQATVGVVKSNVGPIQTTATATGEALLVEKGQRGIWREPYAPQQYNLNRSAFEVTIVSTAKRTVQYTKNPNEGAESEITVRSNDGFTFPVDVRVEYEIKPAEASLVVANFQDDDNPALAERLRSAVRAIFRNNAEKVKALDYVNNRSKQESQSLAMLVDEMQRQGVSVTAVRIGDVGDPKTLGELLKTQTDREIAKQQQVTFQEQQRAAEQRKALTRTQQEAEEEKRLATAQYQVQIAEQNKQQRIINAQAEAEAIRVQAEAQAQAFSAIALQIGRGNAALIELLKIVGDRGVQITPRVMVVGGNGANGSGQAETTALIGTMLDTMMRQSQEAAPKDASPGGG